MPDALPPHDIAAEMSTLGSMLMAGVEDQHVIAEIAELLRPQDFYLPKHADLFRACLDVFHASGSVDGVQLDAYLRQNNLRLDPDGDNESVMVEMVEMVPHAMNGPYYARIVRQCATRRKIIEACDRAEQSARDGKPIDELLGALEVAIAESAQSLTVKEPRLIGDVAREVVQSFYDREEGDSGGVDTGYASLDAQLNGLHPGDMCVIAARPGMGKTALALNIAENIAARCPVGLLSLEMPESQITSRSLAARAGINATALRGNALEQEDRERLTEAAQALADLPIWIDDTPALTPPVLKAKVRQLVDRRGVGLVLVDYLQIMQAVERGQSRNEQVTEFSAAIKQAARQCRIPIVVLSQLNRHPGDGAKHPPNMSRLRDSGAIEQDADQVLLIHRPDYYDRHARPGEVDLIIEKNRHGPTGTVVLTWSERTASFGEAPMPGMEDVPEAQAALGWD